MSKATLSMDNVFSIMSQAFKLSKDEKTAEEAYIMALQLFKEGKLPNDYHITFAWILYRRLKAHYQSLGSKESRQTLALYLQLNTERPSVVHSSFLYLAISIKKTYPEFKFTKFFSMWGVDNFRDDDWMPFKAENTTIMSLAQKTIYQAMAEMKTINDSDMLVMMNTLLTKATARYPKTAEHQRQLGIILARQGLRKEAVNAYKQALLTEQKAYFWSELAELIGTHELRKAALCMTLTVQRNDDFVGAIHLRLAEMLIEEGDFPQALVDLNKVYATYSHNRWTIPADYYRLSAAIPQGTQPAQRSKAWLEQMAMPARDFLLDDLPMRILLIEKFFNSKKGQEMATLKNPDGSSFVLPKKKLKVRKALEPGEFIKARIKQDDQHRVALLGIDIASDDEAASQFGKIVVVEGPISIKCNAAGKPFAFVRRCYVGHNLLAGLNDRDTVRVKAIQKDGKTTAITHPIPISK